MSEQKAKRPVCVVCGVDFRREGGKVTCSKVCSSAHKTASKGIRRKRPRSSLCTDKSDKQYILVGFA